MIKSVTFKNILSFKNETTVDFEVYRKADDTVKTKIFKKRNVNSKIEITQFALIYGKNNSGKSNLLRVLNSIFSYIRNNSKLDGNPFTRFGTQNKMDIEVEIELISESSLYRYGFILNHQDLVKNEWLYANIELSKTETTLFERSSENTDDNKISMKNTMKKFEILIDKLNPDKLLLSLLFDFDVPEIQSLKDIIYNEIGILNIEERAEFNIPIDRLDRICDNPSHLKTINHFLRKFDTNINALQIDHVEPELAKKLDDITELIQQLKRENKSHEEITDFVNSKFGENAIANLLASLPSLNLFGRPSNDDINSQVYSIRASFKDTDTNKDYDIQFSDLSFGTRKLISFLINLLCAPSGTIILVDEIEHGFHKRLLLDFMKTLFEIATLNGLQFIFTTHEEDLMDLNEISSEGKIILNNNNDTKITYLSDFKLRSDLKKSKRYLSGAYLGVPEIKDNHA